MSDLVKRLRSYGGDDIRKESADRIEALEAALREAIDHLVRLDAFVDGQGYRPTIRGTVALGRVALAPEKNK
jgi:hypothetical protein